MLFRRRVLAIFPIVAIIISLVFSPLFSSPVPVYAAAQTLYGCTSLGSTTVSSLYTINPSTGAATLVGSMNIVYDCSALKFSSSGVLYAMGATVSGTESLFTVNTATGAATLVGSVARGATCGVKSQPNEVSDMDFSPSGTLYIMFGESPHCLATVNPSTAAETDIGHTGVSGGGNALAISSGNTFYHASDNPILYTLNPSTGAATLVATMSVSGGFPSACTKSGDKEVSDLAFNSGGTLYGVLNCGSEHSGPNYLVTVNRSTGVMTLIGQTVTGLDGLGFNPIPIPEYPLGLFLLTILMVIGYGLIRRRVSNPKST